MTAEIHHLVPRKPKTGRQLVVIQPKVSAVEAAAEEIFMQVNKKARSLLQKENPLAHVAGRARYEELSVILEKSMELLEAANKKVQRRLAEHRAKSKSSQEKS